MASERHTDTDLIPVQHPIILRSALPEAVIQLLIMGGTVAILVWLRAGFELTLLVLLIFGFTLNTLNVIAATISQNVHLAEIRDLLLKQNGDARR